MCSCSSTAFSDLGPREGVDGFFFFFVQFLLLVSGVPGGIDKTDGHELWRTEETAINSPIFGSWSTPVILSVDGHDEMILPLPGEKIGGEGFLKGYDPATGKELWHAWGWGTRLTPCRWSASRPI